MNATQNDPDTTRLSSSALTLEQSFAEMDRIAGEITRLEVASDAGLDRGRRLLVRFSECGERVGEAMRELTVALENARRNGEEAARKVSERAQLIQRRHTEAEVLMSRFRELGVKAHAVNESLMDLKGSPALTEPGSEEGEGILRSRIPVIESKLDELAGEASRLKVDAHASNMKELERDAHTLVQTLQTARRKIGYLAA